MDEILASIRRIIADDDAAKSPPYATAPPPDPSAAAEPPHPAPSPASPVDPVLWQDEIDVMVNEAAPAPVHNPAAASRPAADVLDLTEAMAPSTPADAFRTIDGRSNLVFEGRAAAHEPDEAVAPGRAAVRPPIHHEAATSLISSSTSAAVDSAFNALAHTVLVQNARTLEDLAREMLRPMLKSWLDDNLPGLVERLVRAEIERVSRGRG